MENKTAKPALAADPPQDLTERQLLVLDEICRIGAKILAVAAAQARSGEIGADEAALAVEMIRRTVRRTDAMRCRLREQAARAAALAAAARDRSDRQGGVSRMGLIERVARARLERDFFKDAATDTSRPRGLLH